MSKRSVLALAVAGAALLSSAAQAQDTIRVGWTIPAEESKYWMMRRPDQFEGLGKTYKIEWTQFQGTAAKGGLRKLFSLADQQANIVHILEVCRKEFVDKNPELVKSYVRGLTAGMKQAIANRAETLKVVNEVIKAPVEVLDTYLLKPNDFAREPGAAPNFAGIQTMFDIYAETGMIKQKLDAAQFRHASIVAPLE